MIKNMWNMWKNIMLMNVSRSIVISNDTPLHKTLISMTSFQCMLQQMTENLNPSL